MSQLHFSFDVSIPQTPGPVDAPDVAPTPSAPPPAVSTTPIFIRHRRARRYVLRVTREGVVRVTMPPRGTLREAKAFVAAHRKWIEARQRECQQRPAPPVRDAQRVQRERELRAQAARELPGMLHALALQHGITVPRVSIRDQRTRWGACSARGGITLNWRLICLPPFVREYVLLHELMHRRELNHSRRFWRLVAEVCPRFQEARRWLKRVRIEDLI